MPLNNVPTEVLEKILRHVCSPADSDNQMSWFVELRLVSHQFDAVISRIILLSMDLQELQKRLKSIARPSVKWMLLTKATTSYRSNCTGPFSFMHDAARFFSKYKKEPPHCKHDHIEEVCRAIVYSNNHRSKFMNLVHNADLDPTFHELKVYQQQKRDQEWTREGQPELFYGALQIASACADVSVIESLALTNSDLNHQHLLFGSAMHISILCDHVDVVKTLTKNGVHDVLASNDEKQPLLFFAAEANRPRLVQYFLGLSNPQVNFNTRQGGVSTLLWACRRGWTSIAARLLARADLDPNPETEWKETPLGAAIKGGFEDIVRLFISRDDFKPVFRKSRISPLNLAVVRGYATIVALLLERYNHNPNMVLTGNKPLLCRAAELGQTSIVRTLLDRDDIDPNQAGSDDKPPIFLAVMANDVEIVRMLLGNEKLNLGLLGHGSTVLQKVVMRNDLEVAELLLNRQDLSFWAVQNALQISPRYASSKMLWLLLTHDRVIREFNDDMHRVLEKCARMWGRDKFLRKLIAQGSLEPEWELYLRRVLRFLPPWRRIVFSDQKYYQWD